MKNLRSDPNNVIPLGREPDKVEYTLLAGLLFFLPLFEAPKNLFLYGYLFYWFYRRKGTSLWGEKDLHFDVPLLSVVGLGLFTSVCVANVEHLALVSVLKGNADFLSLALIAICIRRTNWRGDFVFYLASIFLALGILASITEGVLRGGAFPSLRSVGHINQTAIFLSMSSVAIFWGAVYSTENYKKVLMFLISFILLYLTVETSSRNAFYAVLITTLLVTAIAFRKHYFTRNFFVTLMSFLLVSFAFLYMNPALIEKQRHHLSTGSLDLARQKLLYTSWIVALDRPLIGHGPDRFSEVVTEQYLKKLYKEKNAVYTPDQYFYTSHAHNWLFNFLVERGVLATAIFLYWLGYLAFLFVHHLWLFQYSAKNNEGYKIVVTGFAILLMGIFAGLGNTTFRQEHGLLTMIAIGLGHSLLRATSRREWRPSQDGS